MASHVQSVNNGPYLSYEKMGLQQLIRQRLAEVAIEIETVRIVILCSVR